MICLSKSKVMSALQCSKRLYLEIASREFLKLSDLEERAFLIGIDVGEVARRTYKAGQLIANKVPEACITETKALFSEASNTAIFEAAFLHGTVLIRAHIISKWRGSYHLAEVKSSKRTEAQLSA